jgi:hypothetical protein
MEDCDEPLRDSESDVWFRSIALHDEGNFAGLEHCNGSERGTEMTTRE